MASIRVKLPDPTSTTIATVRLSANPSWPSTATTACAATVRLRDNPCRFVSDVNDATPASPPDLAIVLMKNAAFDAFHTA